MHIQKTILIMLLGIALTLGWLARSIAQEISSSNAVTILDRTKVGGAFVHPNFHVLLRGKSGEGNFLIIAASRDKPGEVEVHNLDTDIFYIISGAATLVTGGIMVEPKTTAYEEIRGKSIDSGESRQVSQGEVIVIPHGVPHWFKEVHEPLHYFVVKVH